MINLQKLNARTQRQSYSFEAGQKLFQTVNDTLVFRKANNYLN